MWLSGERAFQEEELAWKNKSAKLMREQHVWSSLFLKGFIWLTDVASVYSLKKFGQGTRQILFHYTDKGIEAWRSCI